ncbi:PE-PPE domain-containing protein [Gordonia sp. ABSL1-1]|uniref:PE-PPE domain-containing protein n=1 Tax=Gordonia sp. ABSL1-1 TaxID=3053923 RepID=UPI00257292B8|nr:PE-PPE domain-containing protein [Gordonia sp. ABSL1-1]MDL9939028.1 PE-PPE domain-containing protein [Gordonia sp. ABSL1-1]
MNTVVSVAGDAPRLGVGDPGFAEQSVLALFVGGTGESSADDRRDEVSGLLARVADELDERFVTRWIGYPASYGPAPRLDGISFTDSVAIGVDRLRAAIRASVQPLVLVGYSQGAVVIRTALSEMSAVCDPALSGVLAVGLVADPHQPPGVVDGCAGWGVAGPGPRLPEDVPIRWVGASDDVICNADADSFVRDIADLTAAISFAAPRAWLVDCWRRLRANSFQNAGRTSLRPSQWRRDLARIANAWAAVACYLPASIVLGGLRIRNRRGGRHTSYVDEPYRSGSVTDPESSGCVVVARWLQVQVTFAGCGLWEAARVA